MEPKSVVALAGFRSSTSALPPSYSMQSRLNTSELTLENIVMLLKNRRIDEGQDSLNDEAMDTTCTCENRILMAATVHCRGSLTVNVLVPLVRVALFPAKS